MKYILGKCDYYGNGRRSCEAEITWEFKDGRFSMQAGIWNSRHTDHVIGGQCVDTVVSYFPHNKKAKRMLAIWKRWHLNDMRAGSPDQEQYLRNLKEIGMRLDYTEACKRLAQAGLNPDPKTGYSYGEKWLFEEIPDDVKAEIMSWE